jgi:hypothetical protein
MKRTKTLMVAAVLGLSVPLAGASAAQAATYECHVFKNGEVHCELMPAFKQVDRLNGSLPEVDPAIR